MFNALMNSSKKRLRHWQTDNFSSLGQTLSTWPFEISDKFEACRHGSCCSVTEKSFLFFQKKIKYSQLSVLPGRRCQTLRVWNKCAESWHLIEKRRESCTTFQSLSLWRTLWISFETQGRRVIFNHVTLDCCQIHQIKLSRPSFQS